MTVIGLHPVESTPAAVSPRLLIIVVGSPLLMTVIGLHPATDRGGTLLLVLRQIQMIKTNGIPLTKVIEIQHGNPQLKSGEDIPATHMQNTRSQRSLSQDIQTVVPADQKATAIAHTQRTMIAVREIQRAAAVAVKKVPTAAEAKVAGDKASEPRGTKHLMGITRRDIIRRCHV